MADAREDWLDAPDPGQRPAELPFLALEDTFVSGDRTGRRFRIRYYRGADDDRLWGKILFGAGAQGPPDHVHGGAMAAILDEAMGGAAWQSGHPVVAANLDISFRHMLPLDAACVVEARITAADGRKITTTATLRDRDGGQVFAEGRGVFVVLEKRHLDAMSGKADVIVERMRRLRDPEKDD